MKINDFLNNLSKTAVNWQIKSFAEIWEAVGNLTELSQLEASQIENTQKDLKEFFHEDDDWAFIQDGRDNLKEILQRLDNLSCADLAKELEAFRQPPKDNAFALEGSHRIGLDFFKLRYTLRFCFKKPEAKNDLIALADAYYFALKNDVINDFKVGIAYQWQVVATIPELSSLYAERVVELKKLQQAKVQRAFDEERKQKAVLVLRNSEEFIKLQQHVSNAISHRQNPAGAKFSSHIPKWVRMLKELVEKLRDGTHNEFEKALKKLTELENYPKVEEIKSAALLAEELQATYSRIINFELPSRVPALA